MNRLIAIFNFILLTGFVTCFVKFEDGIEYEFRFKSKFVLTPEVLGGQRGEATLLVKKLGKTDKNLVVRIKDSSFTGTNVNEESTSNIEGVFGLKRDSNGALTHIVAKSTRAKSVLTKRNIVGMLIDDMSFFRSYLENPRQTKQKLSLSIGMCDCEISAVRDSQKHLTKIFAQALYSKCDVDQIVLKAGQYLLNGSTKQLAEIKPDSNVGMTVILDSNNGNIKEVSKYTFLNVRVGIDLQARHNMVLTYIGQHPATSETDLQKPFTAFTMPEIDTFVRNQDVQD